VKAIQEDGKKMGYRENKMKPIQFMFLLIQAQIGVSVLSLPHDIYEYAKGMSWLTVISSGVFFQIVVLLFCSLLKRHDAMHLFEITKLLTGTFFGTCINVVYTVFGILVSALACYYFFYILRTWAYPLTPKWVFISMFMLTVGYLAKNNIRAIVRFATVTIITHPFLLIILLIVSIQGGRLVYLFPLWGSVKMIPFIQSYKGVIGGYVGAELILYLYPQVSGTHKEKLKWISFANLYVTLFYLFIVIVSLCIFKSLDRLPEPVLSIVKSLSLTILERMDLIFLSIWVITSVNSVGLSMYGSSLGLTNMIHKTEKDHVWIVWLVVVIASVLAVLCELLIRKEVFIRTIEFLTPFIYLIFPLALLLLSIRYTKKKGVSS
jgi:spore germination protein (amino acid permease)